MQALHSQATIRMCNMDRNYYHDHRRMIAIQVTFPEIKLAENKEAEKKINRRIQAQIQSFCNHAYQVLYPQAISDYENAQEKDFPFHPYESILVYTVTYNQQCHLSMYRDRYNYTGGAHGNTVRASDTWNLRTGYLLAGLPGVERPQALQLISMQAAYQMQQNSGIYFEDYQKLLTNTCHEKSFYLTPSGVSVYFQQYDIAPYASGIVVFTLPYHTIGWYPSCRKLKLGDK